MAEDAPDAAEDPARYRWLEQFRRGDRGLLSEIYQTHFERIRKAVARVLFEAADRDNVVQQLFADLVESAKLRQDYGGGDLGAWLCAIARHKAIDFGRRQSRLQAIDGNEFVHDEGQESLREFRADLERFADTLPLERQRMLQLRFIEGLTQVEASLRMHVPRTTLEDWERQMKVDLRLFLLGGGSQSRKARP